MKTLTVTSPFGGHAIGDRIDDPAEVERILAGEHAHHVVPSIPADVAATTSEE